MIRIQRPHVGVATSTHPGRSGKANEDRLGTAAYQGASGRPVFFAVVSDGIGGHLAGEVAAELTVERILSEISSSNGADPLEAMQTAIRAASNVIAERAAAHVDQAGMGSTCACAWIEDSRLYTSYVGDSRIYLVRGGEIHRTSVDHTWVQEALEKGVISPEHVHDHPNAHVLRRHLGSTEPPEVDTRLRWRVSEDDEQARSNQGLPLLPGDILLLCTDGLTDMIEDEEILRLVHSRRALPSAARELVASANQHGGRDNITVVLVGIPLPRRAARTGRPARSRAQAN